MAERYHLMHRDTVVAELSFDYGCLYEVRDVVSPDHMPYGTFRDGAIGRKAFREWWEKRAMSQKRRDVSDLLFWTGMDDVEPLILRSMGLSLSDSYWVRPSGSDVSWADVNFFENGFSGDVGDVLFRIMEARADIDFSSPDIVTEGMLRKRWKVMDGGRFLIKGGNCYHQEPFDEVFASQAMDLLGIPHVGYSLMQEGEWTCSVCKDMVDGATELVPAARAMLSSPIPDGCDYYDHYVSVCRDHGIDIVGDLDRMLVLDFLISNHDRHFNNFGIIRDAETLEWISAAPIYDCGSSMGHNLPTEMFDMARLEKCKPFAKAFTDQMRFVKSTDWLDREALKSLPALVEDVFSESNGWIFPARTKLLTRVVESRIARLG